MAKGTKREILPRTVKWEVAARQPDLQKLLIKTSDGLREYEHWALEAEAENYKRFEEWQTLLGLLWDIKVTFGAQTKKELLGVLMSLIIGNEEAARLGKGRGELDRLLRKFNRETRPKSFLTDFDLYSRYAPMREEDGRETKARATIPAVLQSPGRGRPGYPDYQPERGVGLCRHPRRIDPKLAQGEDIRACAEDLPWDVRVPYTPSLPGSDARACQTAGEVRYQPSAARPAQAWPLLDLRHL